MIRVMFGPNMGKWFAARALRATLAGKTRLRLCRSGLEFHALKLLWTTWEAMCDFADVGFADWQPRGVWLNAHGEIVSGTTNRMGLRIPCGAVGSTLAAEGDWVVRGPGGELFPVPDARLRDLFEVLDER